MLQKAFKLNAPDDVLEGGLGEYVMNLMVTSVKAAWVGGCSLVLVK